MNTSNKERYILVSEADNNMWWMWEEDKQPRYPWRYAGIIEWKGEVFKVFVDDDTPRVEACRLAMRAFTNGTRLDLKNWKVERWN